jgi:hypothetical protein
MPSAQQYLAITRRVFCGSAQTDYEEKQRSFAGSRKLEEWVVDRVLFYFRGSSVIEEEVKRKLHSDLKC